MLRSPTVEAAGAAGESALKGRASGLHAGARRLRRDPVYDRYRLAPGDAFDGPAIVEERESTVVLGPGARARIDDALNLIADLA